MMSRKEVNDRYRLRHPGRIALIYRVLRKRYPWRNCLYKSNCAARRRGEPVIEMADWKAKWDQFGGRCGYCNGNEFMGMDHMIPIHLGGKHEIGNVVPCCRSCNGRKAATPPERLNGVEPVTKVCKRCRVLFPISRFRPRREKGRSPFATDVYCRPCRKADAKKRDALRGPRRRTNKRRYHVDRA